MIREAKRKPALHALNDLLVRARTMAFEKAAYESISAFLDAVEELPMLIAREEDLTDDYRSALEGIASTFPEAGVALQRFDGEIPS